MKVKIIGAGSAGIHLAQACRRMGWDVWVLDNDPRAFERICGIYAARYGKWDDKIYFADASMRLSSFDIIMISTPPDVRMKLALEAIKENPRLLHLEKPLCTPDLKGVAEFEAEMKKHSDTIVTVGYDHAVSKSIARVVELLQAKKIGEVLSIDVEFREHWKGIFAAHPWLKGPQDSYLGYWKRGGGAGNEHSHALHLWIVLARQAWGGCVNLHPLNITSHMAMGPGILDGLEYDHSARFIFQVIGGHVGSVVQDVITNPPKKWARIQGKKGFIEWYCGEAKNFDSYNPDGDVVKWRYWYGDDQNEYGGVFSTEIFEKKRPDDFYYEMQHYAALLDGEEHFESPLSYRSGREVMDILNKAYYG